MTAPQSPSSKAGIFSLRSSAAAVVATLLVLTASGPVAANWLTRLGHLAEDAGSAGAKTGKLGLGALDGAAGFVAKLPPAAKGSAALAAHVTPEGHWKFVNREGSVFTAANPDELGRVTGTLAPELAHDGKLALYLSEDAVFEQRAFLKDLPERAELHVVAGNESYALVRGAVGDGAHLFAEIRTNLLVEISERPLFDEAVFQLGRPLNRSNIRVLSLEPGGPNRLTSAPRLDAETKAALVDQIDPSSLASSLSKIRGQTVLVTGRLDGDALYFRLGSGTDQKLSFSALKAAAEDADVNLLILQSPAPVQPGGRNWLWQKVGVAGLDEALKRATIADFLDALGSSRGRITVTTVPDSYGRILLQAASSGESGAPIGGKLAEWAEGLAHHVTGEVAVHVVTAVMRDSDRTRELDSRIIPGIPAWIQGTWIGAIIAGLLGWSFSVPWWRRVWPSEAREEYASAFGYRAAQVVRLLAFLVLFLPLAGLPALIATLAVQVWNGLTSPLRFWRWLRGRSQAHAG